MLGQAGGKQVIGVKRMGGRHLGLTPDNEKSEEYLS
jgi:hypothetical protein